LRGQDPAIRAGLARIGGERVIVVAANRVGGLRRAVTGAFGTARPGDRDRRLAKATRSFIAAHPVLT